MRSALLGLGFLSASAADVASTDLDSTERDSVRVQVESCYVEPSDQDRCYAILRDYDREVSRIERASDSPEDDLSVHNARYTELLRYVSLDDNCEL
jgi:hypothetical protein